MTRWIRASVLLAVVALSACEKKPEPQPVEDPVAAAAARRARGDSAIRARRAELRKERAARNGSDDPVRTAYELCRRNNSGKAREDCNHMLNSTRPKPNPRDYEGIDITRALRTGADSTQRRRP